MIFLTLFLLFTNKCFYKCIFNTNLLDVIKRNKQKAWCMNTVFTHCTSGLFKAEFNYIPAERLPHFQGTSCTVNPTGGRV
jgi:hypothetical protein